MHDIHFKKPKLHFFVCTNDRSSIPDNTTPSCSPTIQPKDVKIIKQWIRENGWTLDVYCSKASCLGFCNNEGGVACVYPPGRFVKGLRSVDDIKKFITEEVDKLR